MKPTTNIIFPSTHSEVVTLLEQYNIQNYTINSDLTVDVDGDVDLSDRELTQLPIRFGTVSGDFDCRWNDLTTLVGSPKTIDGNFYCCDNELTTLVGSPETVGCHFYCNYNPLNNLEGLPKRIGGNFDYCFNDAKFTADDVKSVCEVKGEIFV